MFEDRYPPTPAGLVTRFHRWLTSDPPDSIAAQAKAGLVTAAACVGLVAVLALVP